MIWYLSLILLGYYPFSHGSKPSQNSHVLCTRLRVSPPS